MCNKTSIIKAMSRAAKSGLKERTMIDRALSQTSRSLGLTQPDLELGEEKILLNRVVTR